MYPVGPKEGHYLCDAEPSIVKAGWVRGEEGEWVVAVQTDGMEQVMVLARCLYKDRSCEYIPPCYRYYIHIVYSKVLSSKQYRSSCIQDYTTAYIITIAVDHAIPRPMLTRVNIPAACKCFVQDFVFY